MFYRRTNIDKIVRIYPALDDEGLLNNSKVVLDDGSLLDWPGTPNDHEVAINAILRSQCKCCQKEN